MIKFAIFSTLLLNIVVPYSNSLSLPSLFSKQNIKEKPIEKVAIIGSGIAGLSLAHALENSETCAQPYLDALEYINTSPFSSSSTNTRTTPPKYGIESTIFDSRPSFNFEAGAGVQINGGASTLHKINPKLCTAVKEASLPLKKIRSRTKPWFGDDNTKNGGGKAFDTLLELDLKNVIQQTGGDVEKELIVNGEVMAYTIMRGALQETLYDELPTDTSARVNFGKTLVGIEGSNEKNGIMCHFQDGSSEGPFDLVIGCDGINSAVREYVDKVSISKNDKEKRLSSSIYSGIRIQYAVQDGNTIDEAEANSIDEAELVQYFGEGAYSLAGVYGAGKGRKPNKGAFLISRDEGYFGPFKIKSKDDDGNPTVKDGEGVVEANENADWTQDVQSLGSDMTKRILECEVPDVQIGPIVKDAERFFELGVYFHNPFSFNGWSRQVENTGCYVVLAGDAAHAMPPFLGQGSNQAIQDSFSLASTIFEHNSNCLLESTPTNIKSEINGDDDNGEVDEKPKPLQQLLKQYENIRWAPTTSITLKAILLGYLETGQRGFLSKFRDAFFFFAGKVGLARKVFLDSATPQIKQK